MKVIVVFALILAFASAFRLPGSKIPQHKPLLPMVGEKGPNGRITNGQTAAANQFPYQVGLSLYDGAHYRWCGGSIISNEWVLTAAHCTIGIESVIILLGGVVQLEPELMIGVNKSNIITHPGYNAETIINDIALINTPPIEYTNAIQPVALPKIASSYPSYVGDDVIASGWGLTSDTASSTAPVLQYADLKVISNQECENVYGSEAIYGGKICVATPNATATCSGDSGGPLVLASSKVQIGITSFGAEEGCEAGLPDAFTRVEYYLDWILNNTRITL